MNIAKHVIAKCGGVKAVSEGLSAILGERVPPGRVYLWTYPRLRGGSGGQIPARHQLPLLRWARGRGLDLRPEDFFGLDANLDPLPGVTPEGEETLSQGGDARQFNSAPAVNAELSQIEGGDAP